MSSDGWSDPINAHSVEVKLRVREPDRHLQTANNLTLFSEHKGKQDVVYDKLPVLSLKCNMWTVASVNKVTW